MEKVIKVGSILPVKEYNKIRYVDYKKRVDQLYNEGRYSERPSIEFYIWNKNYGYVYKTDYGSMWAKTKKELLYIKNR